MQGQDYSELGQVLDDIARSRNIRGPYRVAKYVKERTGDGPGGTAWSQFFTGESRPKPRSVQLFALAFEITEEERQHLANVYLFRGSTEMIAA